jgi:glycine/D-amino acid oxidase-like deaminating enzyme
VAGDLLAAARARGVRYRPHTRVRSLLTRGDRVTGVETGGSGDGGRSGGREHAGAVVLAAGVWSPPLLRTAGVVLPIETELHRVAVLAHPPAGGAPVACIDSTTQTYFRPEAAGAMTLVGAFAGQRGATPTPGRPRPARTWRRWSRRPRGGYRRSRTPASHAGSPAYTT